jgi:23S rRNA pseudouridine2605 synthase
MSGPNDQQAAGERVAKAMARAGLGSRRQAEAWIAAERVAVNGKVIASPALNVTAKDRITVDGEPLPARERTRLFLYHKPAGLVTTHADPDRRPTIFAALPAGLPRLVSVGRLDLNTEGLLLLTNDGGLARALELPATGWLRRYRVRAHGRVQQAALDRLRRGITIDGVRYGSIDAALDREQGSNVWLTFAMREGKNREVKNVLGHLGLAVNRLIRVSFGPFQLTGLAEGAIEEVKTRILREQLGERLVELSGADFSAPVRVDQPASRDRADRHAAARAEPAGPKSSVTGRSRFERAEAVDSGPRAHPRDRNDARKSGRLPRDAGRTAVQPSKPVRRRSRRSEAERLGEPELARREKRYGRKRVRGPTPPRGKKR